MSLFRMYLSALIDDAKIWAHLTVKKDSLHRFVNTKKLIKTTNLIS